MKGYLIINDLNKKIPELSQRNYSGFDVLGYAQVWPLLEEWSAVHSKIATDNYVAESMDQYPAILSYYTYIKGRCEFLRFLYIATLNEKIDAIDEHFKFIGFDYGVLIEEDYPVFFSSVLNEFLIVDKLSGENFKDSLNKYSLFEDLATVTRFDKARKDIIVNFPQNGLESAYESTDFEIVSVYCYRP